MSTGCRTCPGNFNQISPNPLRVSSVIPNGNFKMALLSKRQCKNFATCRGWKSSPDVDYCGICALKPNRP